jgi:hypothetical protein
MFVEHFPTRKDAQNEIERLSKCLYFRRELNKPRYKVRKVVRKDAYYLQVLN